MRRMMITLFLATIFTVTQHAEIPAQVNFTQHSIADNFDEPWSVYTIDMDGDQDIALIGSARLGCRIAWWENAGGQGFTMHLVSMHSCYAVGIEAADFDNDEDVDIVCASQSNGIELWVTSGDQSFTRRILGSWPYASFLYTKDVDRNGYMDVLVACLKEGSTEWGG